MQSDIIRRYLKPGDFITTNGLFGNLDNHAMRRESLDFMTYDSYPNFAYCLDMYSDNPKNLRDRKWSPESDGDTFGFAGLWHYGAAVPEQMGGIPIWRHRRRARDRSPYGRCSRLRMERDYISYFRWRTCTMGTEIYWHGILDYSSRENRRIREVHDVYEKLQGMQELAGARYEAKVGVLKDYDNIWDAQLDVWASKS